MNVSSLGIAAAAAATPLAQTRGSEIDRVRQETVVHERAVESTAEAESAEGIGTTKEEQAADDRDADGRRPWEIVVDENAEDDANPVTEPPVSQGAKDPSGQAGSQLDLSG